jgi:hypothetical protein
MRIFSLYLHDNCSVKETNKLKKGDAGMEKLMNIYDESDWQEATEYSAGTRKKVLFDENGMKTIVLRLPKGFSMALHSHLFNEQHYIIEGEYNSNGIVFRKGTHRCFKAHETHGPFESRSGAMVLVIWSPAHLVD